MTSLNLEEDEEEEYTLNLEDDEDVMIQGIMKYNLTFRQMFLILIKLSLVN